MLELRRGEMALGELLELQVILLDGCVQLKFLPGTMSRLASLKTLSVINCHLLAEDATGHLSSGCKIVRAKEESSE